MPALTEPRGMNQVATRLHGVLESGTERHPVLVVWLSLTGFGCKGAGLVTCDDIVRLSVELESGDPDWSPVARPDRPLAAPGPSPLRFACMAEVLYLDPHPRPRRGVGDSRSLLAGRFVGLDECREALLRAFLANDDGTRPSRRIRGGAVPAPWRPRAGRPPV